MECAGRLREAEHPGEVLSDLGPVGCSQQGCQAHCNSRSVGRRASWGGGGDQGIAGLVAAQVCEGARSKPYVQPLRDQVQVLPCSDFFALVGQPPTSAMLAGQMQGLRRWIFYTAPTPRSRSGFSRQPHLMPPAWCTYPRLPEAPSRKSRPPRCLATCVHSCVRMLTRNCCSQCQCRIGDDSPRHGASAATGLHKRASNSVQHRRG